MKLKFSNPSAEIAKKYDELFPVQNCFIEVNPGKVYLPRKFADIGESIKDLKVYEDDVWLVSYPRTGSTWAQEMIWLLGNNLDYEGAKKVQQVRCPVVELSAIFGEDHFDWVAKIRVKVTLGITSLSGKQPGKQTFKVKDPKDIITHPKFIRNGLFNDIALIKLPKDIEFTKNISAINMTFSNASYSNQLATASGFGRIDDITGTNQLWFAVLKVMSNRNCRDHYGSIITNEKICTFTGPPAQSTCTGDSGGPLILNSNKTLIGISSFVGTSCVKNEPAGFQRINVHKKWIEKTTGEKFD